MHGLVPGLLLGGDIHRRLGGIAAVGVHEVGVRGHVALPCEALLRVTSMALSKPFRCALRPPSPRLRTPTQRPYAARCGTKTFRSVGVQGRRQRDAGMHARGTKRPSGPAAGPVVKAKRRTERERAGLLRYYPQYGGDRSGVFRDQAVPTTWRGIGDRSARACAGVGIGLVSECLRGPSHGGPLRGDEKRGKPTGNNNLPAVDRGWRVGLVTNIARRSRRDRAGGGRERGRLESREIRIRVTNTIPSAPWWPRGTTRDRRDGRGIESGRFPCDDGRGADRMGSLRKRQRMQWFGLWQFAWRLPVSCMRREIYARNL